jgi:hypothetical protein
MSTPESFEALRRANPRNEAAFADAGTPPPASCEPRSRPPVTWLRRVVPDAGSWPCRLPQRPSSPQPL